MKDYTTVIPMTFKISIAQKEKLNELATELNRSQSELIREAIMALLGVYYGREIEEEQSKAEDALVEVVDEGVVNR